MFLIALFQFTVGNGTDVIAVSSANAAGGVPASKKENLTGKGPITITSEALSSDKKANKAFFEGNVVARTEKMTLYSDRMTVYYTEGGGEVHRIEAEGNVRLVKDKQVITSGRALYLQSEQTVVFTENPKAVENGDVVIGTKMTYFVDEERSIVENSRVFLERK